MLSGNLHRELMLLKDYHSKGIIEISGGWGKNHKLRLKLRQLGYLENTGKSFTFFHCRLTAKGLVYPN